ncbi:MAG: DoxX family protein [Alphaproteobacteria bacterium]|nr:DoxX family protein [Alphaproteobacteria bacterium]
MRRIFEAMPWLLALWIAYIFIWYLQYKFTGADGSVWLFTVLTDWLGFSGYEKPMRIGVGAAELLAAILVLIRRTQVFGAAMSAGIMAGAIFFHVVSPLGIDPYEDGAVLFTEACLVLLAALAILWLRRDEALDLARQLPVVGRYA